MVKAKSIQSNANYFTLGAVKFTKAWSFYSGCLKSTLKVFR